MSTEHIDYTQMSTFNKWEWRLAYEYRSDDELWDKSHESHVKRG